MSETPVPVINPEIVNIDNCEQKDVIDTATRQAMAMLMMVCRIDKITEDNFAEVCARIALAESLFGYMQWVRYEGSDEKIAVPHTPEIVRFFIGATAPVDPLSIVQWLKRIWAMHLDNVKEALQPVQTND